MKKFIVYLFLIFGLTILYAADLADLHITAFKPVDSGVKLVVNDALTRNNITSDGQIIDLDQNGSAFIGQIPSYTPSSIVGEVAFSYRIEGAEPSDGSSEAKYKLNLTLEPFKQVIEEQDSEEDKEPVEINPAVIPAYFQLGNFNVTFPGAAQDNVTDKNKPESKGWRIFYSEDEKEVTTLAAQGMRADESQNASFDVEIGVKKGDAPDAAAFAPNWVARGAVGVIIDYSSYQSADTPYGRYQSNVTVTLEVVN